MKEYYIFLHKILNYFITVIKSLNRDSIIFWIKSRVAESHSVSRRENYIGRIQPL